MINVGLTEAGKLRKRLNIIFFISVPVVALSTIFLGLYLENWMLKNLLATIGSSVLATSIVIFLERVINGNPFSDFNEKILLFGDAEEAGLKRIVIDRNRFFHSGEIADYISNSNIIRIYGTALGFLIENRRLYDEVKRVAGLKNSSIEILIANPNSEIVAYRDSEEGWNGALRGRIKTSITELFSLKEKFPESVKLYIFSGEIHNTTISTEKIIIVNPYAFGKKGWLSPALVFSRTNQTIINDFDEQINEMVLHGKSNSNIIFSLENKEQLKSLLQT